MRLIIILILCLFTFAGIGQSIQRSSGISNVDDSLEVPKKLSIPSDTTQKKTNSIAYINGTLYVADGTKWVSTGGIPPLQSVMGAGSTSTIPPTYNLSNVAASFTIKNTTSNFNAVILSQNGTGGNGGYFLLFNSVGTPLITADATTGDTKTSKSLTIGNGGSINLGSKIQSRASGSLRTVFVQDRSYTLADSVDLYVNSGTNTTTIGATQSIAPTSPESSYRVDCTSGAITLTITTSILKIGQKVNVKKIDATANNVIIQGSSGNIDGSATLTITTQYINRALLWNGTNFDVL